MPPNLPRVPDPIGQTGRGIRTRFIPGGLFSRGPGRVSFSISLEGAKELEKELQRIASALAARNLAHAIINAAEILRSAASQFAPQGPPHTSPSKQRRVRHLRDDIVRTEPMLRHNRIEARIRVGPHDRAFWGYFQEYGTIFQPAYPWFLPAFQQVERSMRRQIEKDLAQLVTKNLLGRSTSRAVAMRAGILAEGNPLGTTPSLPGLPFG